MARRRASSSPWPRAARNWTLPSSPGQGSSRPCAMPAHAAYPESREDAHDTLDLRRREPVARRRKAAEAVRDAVAAAQVAALGDRQAQLVDPAPVPVDQGALDHPPATVRRTAMRCCAASGSCW
jgi:hypothetical protein